MGTERVDASGVCVRGGALSPVCVERAVTRLRSGGPRRGRVTVVVTFFSMHKGMSSLTAFAQQRSECPFFLGKREQLSSVQVLLDWKRSACK